MVALVTVSLAGVAQAAPTTTTLTFDGLAPGQTVGPADGITFDDPVSAGFSTGTPGDGLVHPNATCGLPIVAASPSTQSPPNYAKSPCLRDREEASQFGTFAVLTNFATRVTVFVGDPTVAAPARFEVDAYDIDQRLIGTQAATSTAADVNVPITLNRPAGVYDIAFLVIWSTTTTRDGGIDNLSFVTDPAVTPPQISLSTSAGGQISQGGTLQYRVSLFRHNGSNGNVDLSISGLPSGIHASFSPATITGTGTTSQLVVRIDPAVPLGSYAGTILATPGAGAGDVTGRHSSSLQVVAAFSVSTDLAGGQTLLVPRCGSASTRVHTLLGPGFSGSPVNLALRTSGPTTGLASISLDAPSLSNPGDFGAFGINDQRLTITRDDDPTASSFEVDIAPTSGPFAEPPARVDVAFEPLRIDRVSPTFAKTAQALRPGTEIQITGSGFCPGATVQFGNTEAWAQADYVSADGTFMTVQTPPLATSGFPGIVRFGKVIASAPQSVIVDSYRNVNGYSFPNYGPHITFDQMTEAFGADQTYDSVNVCIFGCTVTFRDPFAMTLNAIANAAFGSSDGGACFGFSVSTQRFLEGHRSLSDYSPGNSGSIFGLVGPPNNGSGPIVEYINAMQASMLSYEFLGHWLGEVDSHLSAGGPASGQVVYNQITSILAQGRFPIIALWPDSGVGHIVVAYNVHGSPPGNWSVDVYDSNAPFSASEDPQTASLSSRIYLDSFGDWSLPSTKNMTGHMPLFVVTDPGSLPDPPSMVGGTILSKTLALGYVLFGSANPPDTSGATAAGPAPSRVAQVSDAAGHTLLAADGSLNADPRTRLAGAPLPAFVGGAGRAADTGPGSAPAILLPRGATAIHETLADTGTGPDTHTILGRGFGAQLTTRAIPGGVDQLAVGPDDAGFSTGAASKPVAVTLIAAAGRARRVAEVSTTSFHGGGDTLAFTDGRDGLELTHHGKATTFSVTLSALGPDSAPQTFTSGPLHIGAGQQARIGAVRWNSLAGSSIRITVGAGTVVVHNHFRGNRLASIASVRARKLGGRAFTLTIARHLKRLPVGAQVVFTWVVRLRGRTVASHSVVEPSGTQSAGFTFRPHRPGRYELTAIVAVSTVSGATQNSSLATRKLSFGT